MTTNRNNAILDQEIESGEAEHKAKFDGLRSHNLQMNIDLSSAFKDLNQNTTERSETEKEFTRFSHRLLSSDNKTNT